MEKVLIKEEYKYKNRDELYNLLINNSIENINRINPAILFDKEDKVVSYWNDDEWDFSFEGKSKENGTSAIFKRSDYKDLEQSYFDEIKYLTLIVYIKKYDSYKYLTIFKKKANQFAVFMRQVQKLKLSTIRELNEELNFIDVLRNIKGLYTWRTLENMLNVLREASEIDIPNFNLKINFAVKQTRSTKNSLSVKDMAIKYSKTESNFVDQTLYIPYALHSKLVSNCIDDINNKSKYLDNMMSFLEEDYLLYEEIKDKCSIKNVSIPSSKKKIRREKSGLVKELLLRYDLNQFESAINIQKEIRILSTSCMILLLSFSGMRINEIFNIKIDGFNIINSEPKMYVIRSFETKITGGQVVDYVTSPIIKDVFEVLNKIHSLTKKYDNTANKDNLFTSSKHQKLIGYGNLINASINLKEYTKEIGLFVSKEDIKESELINGYRDYIKEGEIWPLASHQFRRTLIVNFVSHRLGSINAVKQQVKHIFASMTEYYAKNSNLAESFDLKVVKEISESIENELLEEGVRQYKNIYYSNDILAGEKGKEIMSNRDFTNVLSDDEIKQLFKTGLYKLSKSLYGYCTKGNLCDKKEAIDPTFCGAKCNTMIITKETALNWKKLYIKNKKLLESSSNLIIGGIALSSAKTTMQSQNEIAKQIMNSFNIDYEE